MVRVGLAFVFAVGLFAIPCHGYTFLASIEEQSTAESTVSCDEDGLFPNPDDCGSYVRCADGAYSILPCAGERHFNPQEKRCEEPCDAGCDRSLACECGWDSCQATEAATSERAEETADQEVSKGSFHQSPILCSRTELFPYLLDCTRYVICTGWQVYAMECPPGLHFSEQLLKCVSPCDAHCDPTLAEECKWDSKTSPALRNKYFPYCFKDGLNSYPVSCGLFVMCWNGNHSFMKCPGHLHFSTITEECEVPCDAHCDMNLAKECGWNDTIDPTCVKDGLYPHPENCGRFIHCGHGTPYIVDCPKHLHFSAMTRSCVRPCDAHCDPNLAEECGWNDTPQSSPALRENLHFPYFACVKDGLYSYPLLCGLFIQCSDGNAHVMKCPGSLHFSKITRRCEVPCDAHCDSNLAEECGWDDTTYSDLASRNSPLSYFTCVDGLYPYAENCGLFIQCANGIAYTMNCPEPLHFSEITKRCERSCAAQCDPRLAEECGWIDTPHLSPTCVKDGLYPHPENCGLYIQCVNGVAYTMNCPKPFHFSEITRRCDRPCAAQCDPRFAEKCGWNDTPHPNPALRNTPFPYFTCVKDGLYRHPENCDLFIQCANDIPYIMKCPKPLHFSEITRRCERPCDAHCDPRLAVECGWDDTPYPGGSVCELPRYKGPCSRYTIRYYYDSSDGECKKFAFGGCHSNGNNFETREECLRTCGWRHSPDYPRTPLQDTPRLPVSGFVCSKDGLYRDQEGDCGTYIRCSGDYISIEACPEGLHFSVENSRCEPPCNAHCDESLAELCGWDPSVTYGYEKVTEDSWSYSSSKKSLETTDESWGHSWNKSPAEDSWTDMNLQDSAEDSSKFSTEYSRRYYPEISWKHSSNKNPFLPSETLRQYFDSKDNRKYPDNVWRSSREETKDMPPESAEDSSRYFTDTTLQYTTEDSWTAVTLPSTEYSKLKFSCSNNGVYPNPKDCSTYIDCSNGNTNLMRCPENMHFSQEAQQCEPPCDAHCDASLACDCSWPECKNEEVDCESEPDPGPCKGFVPRYVYDRESGRCRRFIYGGCHGNGNNFLTIDECQEKCEKGMLAGFRCPSYTGNFGHFPDCMSYYQCKRGIPTLKRCPMGTAFHHLKAKCVPEQQAVCVYQCRNPDAVYPVVEDCRKYIDCVNGIPKVERCPVGHSFDVQEGNCVAGIGDSCIWS